MRVAIIGAGISGLSAAHALAGEHEIVLFERERQPGGHTHTVEVPGPGAATQVDMGFIVYNRPTYPRFSALLDELGVQTQPTDMSFGHRCERCDVEFGSVGIGGFLATPRATIRPSHWRMVADIQRFHADARRRLDAPSGSRDTLADLLRSGGYGRAFRDHFMLPVVSAIWSTGATDVLDFPAATLLRFLDNHGLIGFRSGKPWRTIVGGSSSYVRRIIDRLPPGAVRLGDPVAEIRRQGDGVHVRTRDSGPMRFDALVMATHADTGLGLLGDADERERAALSAFSYTTNEVVLHGDARVLPRRGRARGSWNVHTTDCRAPGRLSMTYDMTRLQRLPASQRYLVSVNPGDGPLDGELMRMRMSHPRYTFRTLEGQAAIAALQGHRRTWYAGAHLGYGFHEDGCRSGQDAAAGIAELVGVLTVEVAA